MRIRKFIVLIFLFFLSAKPVFCLQGEYKFDVQFEPPHIIKGTLSLTLHNDTDISLRELLFRTYPNRKFSQREKRLLSRISSYFKTDFFPSGWDEGYLRVERVSSKGERLKFYYLDKESTILKVELPQELKPDQEVELNIDFETKVPHRRGAFGYHKEITSLYYWYPILGVFKEGKWHTPFYYVFHNPYFSDAFLYRMNLSMPGGYNVFSSGKIISKDKGIWRIEAEKPLRDFAMVIFKDLEILEGRFEGIKIRVSYPPGFRQEAERIIDYIKRALRFYSTFFGKYPYSHFDAACLELGYGGNESSALIMLDKRLFFLPKELRRYEEMLVVHETGHQWFYNIVGNNQFKEMFLNEGVNSFCTYLYLEERYGPEAEVLELPKYIDWFLPNFTFFRASLERYLFLLHNSLDQKITSPLLNIKEPSNVFALNYSKAQVVLYMLYNILGSNDFMEGLKEYVKKFSFKNASIEDFRKVLEKVSGKDLEVFFQEWIYSRGFLDYSIERISKDRAKIKNRGDNFIPLKIRKGREEFYIKRRDDLDYEFDYKERVIVDPEFQIVEKDKVNNSLPRNFIYKSVPLYLPVYEWGLFQNPYGYNIILGPYIHKGLGYKAIFSYPYRWLFYTSNSFDLSSQEHIRLGGRFENIFDKPLSVGFDLSRREEYDKDSPDKDLFSWQIYLDYRLGIFSKSIFSVPQRALLYLLHNQSPRFSPQDWLGFNHYFKYKETILGLNINLDSLNPYPLPAQGFRFFFNIESAFKGLDSTRDFLRLQAGLRYNRYLFKKRLILSTRLAGGYSFDENLWAFSLGGSEGLRGYRIKGIDCSKFLFFSEDIFIPLIKERRFAVLGRYLSADSLYLDFFFDAAKAGYGDFSSRSFKKNIGIGIDIQMSLFSFIEKFLLRIEGAWPLKEKESSPRINLRVNFNF